MSQAWPSPPLPLDEDRRLAALQAFHILDTPPDPRFDRLARLAARLLETPIVLVSLIDAERQWFKTCIGLSVPETPRDVAFCAYTILGTEMMDVPDATQDVRFAANPLVTGPPYIRAYVGVPLVVEDGLSLGTLCLIESRPRAPLSPDQRGLVGDIAASVTDLLQAHRAEWTAAQNERLFRTALASINDGFCIHDADDRLRFCNHRYRSFHPASADVIRPGVTFETTVRAAIEQGDYTGDIEPEPGSDGSATAAQERFLSHRLATHRAPGDPINLKLGDGRWLRLAEYRTDDGGTVGILSDITELKLYQRALEDAVTAAEEANQAKSRFLAMMSHEIRTPLNSVLGTLGLLSEMPLDRQQRRLVETGRRSGEALLTLLNDILDFSKIQAGKLTLEPSPFSMSDLIADVLALFGDQAAPKQLKLESRIARDIPAAVLGDAGRVRQIVMNFVSNAVKFTDTGRVTVTATRLTSPVVAGAPAETMIEIAVTDTGPGIAPKDQPDLFREFAQLDSGRTRRFQGTGLGLIITRQLAELMGGAVGVTSEPQKGSRFWVRLPLPAATTPAAARPDTLRRGARVRTTTGGRPRILLAEDNPANQMVLRSILERFNCLVEMVGNGAEAVAAVAAHPFDAVLMDIAMPVMDGVEATRTIRALDQSAADIPVIAVTANAFPEDLETYRRAGLDFHVGKPIVRADLLDALAKAGLVIESTPSDAVAEAAEARPEGGARPPPHAQATKNAAAPYPLLDQKTLARTLADLDEADHARFVTLFLSDLSSQLTGLTPPSSASEAAATSRIAHTLKSTCASFGALALSNAFAGLEHACKAPERCGLEAVVHDIRSLAARTLAAFQDHPLASDTSGASLASPRSTLPSMQDLRVGSLSPTLLRRLQEDLAGGLSMVRTGRVNRDWDRITRGGRYLETLAGIIGADPLRNDAKCLIDACHQRDATALWPLIDNLLARGEQMQETLENRRARDG